MAHLGVIIWTGFATFVFINRTGDINEVITFWACTIITNIYVAKTIK